MGPRFVKYAVRVSRLLSVGRFQAEGEWAVGRD